MSQIKNNPYIYKGLAYVCPCCGEYPGVHFWSDLFCEVTIVRLYIPYFLCGGCRLAHIDFQLVQKIVNNWGGKAVKNSQDYSLQSLQKEVKRRLRSLQVYYTQNAGYRFLRKFKRIRLPKNKKLGT